MDDLDDVVKEFLVESYENLDSLDRELLVLEKDPTSRDSLASIFRTIHTLKGTCGFLGFGKLEQVAHAGEHLLSLLRDGELRLDDEITDGLLEMVDAIRRILSAIEATNEEGGDDYGELVHKLELLRGSGACEVVSDATSRPSASHPECETVPGTASVPHVEASAVEPAEPSVVPPGSEQPSSLPKPHAAPDVTDRTIRVDVGLLDRLMNLVGELVLARNQVVQFISRLEDAPLTAASQRLNLITTELQEGVMKTRMQPIGNVWSKFPRITRDLGRACGKQARLEMEGTETELDKTLIEAVKDPLTHCLRNAIDHGIEPPEARIAAGKEPEGRVCLRAFHEGGQVIVEISDDGGGIDPAKVMRKALDRGVVTPEKAARMSDRDALNLIFAPGFSTAEKVTNVSGRGVGMDVVKTNIERISGTIDLQSTPGRGTTLRIKIPLTLAIIPALIVTSAGDRYAIPQTSLVEVVRLKGDQIGRSVEMIHQTPVHRLRGRLLPLVDLSHELGASDQDDGPRSLCGRSTSLNMVVLQADDRRFGLVVDEVNDTQEIVVKPLGRELKDLACYAGATIMGDGRVVLILDVMGLAQRVHVVSEGHDREPGEPASRTVDKASNRQTLLLFALGEEGRMAVSLSSIARLEEFPRSAIEHAGDRCVVQYRGQIMPLVELSSALGVGTGITRLADGDGEPLSVLVYADGDRSIGLVIGPILDIVEEEITVKEGEGGAGTLGTAVVQQRVTSLLDVESVVRAVDPTFFSEGSVDAVHI